MAQQPTSQPPCCASRISHKQVQKGTSSLPGSPSRDPEPGPELEPEHKSCTKHRIMYHETVCLAGATTHSVCYTTVLSQPKRIGLVAQPFGKRGGLSRQLAPQADADNVLPTDLMFSTSPRDSNQCYADYLWSLKLSKELISLTILASAHLSSKCENPQCFIQSCCDAWKPVLLSTVTTQPQGQNASSTGERESHAHIQLVTGHFD